MTLTWRFRERGHPDLGRRLRAPPLLVQHVRLHVRHVGLRHVQLGRGGAWVCVRASRHADVCVICGCLFASLCVDVGACACCVCVCSTCPGLQQNCAEVHVKICWCALRFDV